jgi:transposase
MLETGNIARFRSVGQFSCYCRCVESKRISNGKKKGEGNAKNGNEFPAFATPTVGSTATRPTKMDHRVHAGHALRRASVTIGRARENSFPRPAGLLRKAAASFDAIAEIRHVLAGTWKKRSQRKPNLD